MIALAEQDNMVGRLVLGRYRIVRLLARGGMGSIYLARNKGAAGFVRPAVVKKILPSYLGDDSAIEMFAREARIMSNLRHPGIVSVIDFSDESGAYVMVLEYVHGTHTGRWLRFLRKTRQQFPVDIALQIIINVLDALDYAHTATALDGSPLAIVHRDIKPSNILVDVSGHVKLADFGIARAPNDHTEADSGTTKLKGTFPYLAPEIFDNVEPSTHTDVYACGVVLHALLSGRNEFAAKEVSTTIMRVLEHTPTRLDELRDDVSGEVADVIARSMAKDPKVRYQTAAELASALREVRGLTEAEANDRLRREAARDFRDERFAELLKIDDLATLEKALTDEGIEINDDEHTEADLLGAQPIDETDPSVANFTMSTATPTVPSAGALDPSLLPKKTGEAKGESSAEQIEATRAARRSAIVTNTAAKVPAPTAEVSTIPGQAPAPKSKTWPIVIALLLGAGVIAGGLVFAAKVLKKDPWEEPEIDTQGGVVESMPDGSGKVVKAAIDAGVEAPVDAAPKSVKLDAGKKTAPVKLTPEQRKKRRLAKINQTIRRAHGSFNSCTRSHQDSSKDYAGKSILVRLELNDAGKAKKVKFEPAKVSATSFGRCLKQAVGARTWPPGGGFSFEIAVTTKTNN